MESVTQTIVHGCCKDQVHKALNDYSRKVSFVLLLVGGTELRAVHSLVWAGVDCWGWRGGAPGQGDPDTGPLGSHQ